MERYFLKVLQTPTNECSDFQRGCNEETLSRNLASFKKRRDVVGGDGNCCFRSIVRELHKCLSTASDTYAEFIKSIGLGIGEEEDTRHLRMLLCDEVQQNGQVYTDLLGITNVQLDAELASYRQRGFFDNNLADVAVKICSDILQIPIVVITSYPQAAYMSFFPIVISVKEPIYLAFNHSCPGHYDATTGN